MLDAMAAPPFEPADLSDKWSPVDAAGAVELAGELARECPEGHVLYRQEVQAVAIRKLRKELICWLPAQQRWAWVHLTWTQEQDPRWPTTHLFEVWASLVAELVEAGRG